MKQKIELHEEAIDLLNLMRSCYKSIDYLTDLIEGDAGQLWDDLVPKWTHKLKIKQAALKRLELRYNDLIKKL